MGAIGLMFNPSGYAAYSSCIAAKRIRNPVKGSLNGPDSLASQCCRKAQAGVGGAAPLRCFGGGEYVKHVGNIYNDSTNVRDK